MLAVIVAFDKGMDFVEALHRARSARAAVFATSSGFDSRTASALMRAPQQQMLKPSLA